MSMQSSAIQRSTLGLHTLEQYEPLIGGATVERIAAKASRAATMRVAHISSTFYGGGVTELLTRLTKALVRPDAREIHPGIRPASASP